VVCARKSESKRKRDPASGNKSGRERERQRGRQTDRDIDRERLKKRGGG